MHNTTHTHRPFLECCRNPTVPADSRNHNVQVPNVYLGGALLILKSDYKIHQVQVNCSYEFSQST